MNHKGGIANYAFFTRSSHTTCQIIALKGQRRLRIEELRNGCTLVPKEVHLFCNRSIAKMDNFCESVWNFAVAIMYGKPNRKEVTRL